MAAFDGLAGQAAVITGCIATAIEIMELSACNVAVDSGKILPSVFFGEADGGIIVEGIKFIVSDPNVILQHLLIGNVEIVMAGVKVGLIWVIPSRVALIPFPIQHNGVPFMAAARIADNTCALNANGVAYCLECFGIGFANTESVAKNAVGAPVIFVDTVPKAIQGIIVIFCAALDLGIDQPFLGNLGGCGGNRGNEVCDMLIKYSLLGLDPGFEIGGNGIGIFAIFGCVCGISEIYRITPVGNGVTKIEKLGVSSIYKK